MERWRKSDPRGCQRRLEDAFSWQRTAAEHRPEKGRRPAAGSGPVRHGSLTQKTNRSLQPAQAERVWNGRLDRWAACRDRRILDGSAMPERCTGSRPVFEDPAMYAERALRGWQKQARK